MNRLEFIKTLGISSLVMNIDSLSALSNWSNEQTNTERMPVLFLGHGSPMNAIEDNQFVRGFHEIAKTLPNPKAILCVSAHWYIKGTKIMSSPLPKIIYDFGGFPEELYRVQYPAKGDPRLASEVQQLLSPYSAELSEDWGLDHGAWTVLMHLFPKADIPVIQLSIDYSQPASYHYELAGLLKGLREKGVLLIGSGNIVHNLGRIDWQNFHVDNHGYDWAREVREKVNHAILDGDIQKLIDYQKNGTAFQNAIPTPDHYLPLIYTLGLQYKGEDKYLFNDKLLAGSLSMTSLKIG